MQPNVDLLIEEIVKNFWLIWNNLIIPVHNSIPDWVEYPALIIGFMTIIFVSLKIWASEFLDDLHNHVIDLFT